MSSHLFISYLSTHFIQIKRHVSHLRICICLSFCSIRDEAGAALAHEHQVRLIKTTKNVQQPSLLDASKSSKEGYIFASYAQFHSCGRT